MIALGGDKNNLFPCSPKPLRLSNEPPQVLREQGNKVAL